MLATRAVAGWNAGLFNFDGSGSMTHKRRIFSPEARNVLLLTAACFGITAGAQSIGPGPTDSPSKQPQVQQAAKPAPAAAPNNQLALSTAFKKADTNKDGRLTKAEAATAPEIARQFNQLDANKDGVLSRREFTNARMG